MCCEYCGTHDGGNHAAWCPIEVGYRPREMFTGEEIANARKAGEDVRLFTNGFGVWIRDRIQED